MAEKTLNTRIILKNADLSAWESSSLTLKKGEVALAAVNTTTSDGASTVVYLMKVGDGSHTFNDLNWLSAPASDVSAWAKKSSLEYDDLPEDLRNEIDALQAAVGTDGAVATQIEEAIKAAIEALDVTDTAVDHQFVTAVSETDGKITVTRAALTADDLPAHTHAISDVTGLQAALDDKATNGELQAEAAARASGDEAIIGKSEDGASANTIYGAKAFATAAAGTAKSEAISTVVGTNTNASSADTVYGAKKYAEEQAQAKANAVLGDTDDTKDDKTVYGALAAVAQEAADRKAADDALAEDIADLEDRIGEVANVMNFKGVVSGDVAPDADTFVVSNYENGDVVIWGNREYVFSNSDNKFHEFGDATGNASAISGLEGRMTQAESRLTTIENTYATDDELKAASDDLQGAIDTKADQTDLDATNELVATLAGTVGGESNGLVKAVADLKTTVGDAESGLVKQVAALEQASSTHATQANLKLATDRIAAIEGNYVKIDNDKLVNQDGDTFIFDCGGATE